MSKKPLRFRKHRPERGASLAQALMILSDEVYKLYGRTKEEGLLKIEDDLMWLAMRANRIEDEEGIGEALLSQQPIRRIS